MYVDVPDVLPRESLDLVDAVLMVNDSHQILQLVPGGYVWVELVVVEVFVVVVFAVVDVVEELVVVDAYLDYDVDGLAGDLAYEEEEDPQHLFIDKKALNHIGCR